MDAHTATIVVDTVDDPFKGTSDPSLGILFKPMSMAALVLCTADPGHPNRLFAQETSPAVVTRARFYCYSTIAQPSAELYA